MLFFFFFAAVFFFGFFFAAFFFAGFFFDCVDERERERERACEGRREREVSHHSVGDSLAKKGRREGERSRERTAFFLVVFFFLDGFFFFVVFLLDAEREGGRRGDAGCV